MQAGAGNSSSLALPQAGANLNPPVTITYGGSANALTISDSGTGKGLSSTLTSSNTGNNAIYGTTSGRGAAIKGVNSGTAGPAGIFQNTDSANSQPVLSISSAGSGGGVSAIITTGHDVQEAALFGQNIAPGSLGVGVQGNGSLAGVIGSSVSGFGLYGYTTGTGPGVSGQGDKGIGVEGESVSFDGVLGDSYSGFGVAAYSVTSYGLYAFSTDNDGIQTGSYTGHGITAHSQSSIGVYGSSDTGYGVWGQSKNAYGVIGEDSGSGVGVYGSSATGYAGFFNGKVIAQSYNTLSDRNAKTNIVAVNGSDVLERVSKLPISSWTFKNDPKPRHVGPMAQDFYAAFGLNGDDHTHINLSDSAGVSLAAIQELNRRLKHKDEQIAQMTVQIVRNEGQIGELKAMNEQFSARMTRLEQQASGAADTMTASLKSEARVGSGGY
jgi:hypothetical protein